MLTIHDQGNSLCDGLTRREWLRIGGLGLFGLSLPSLFQARRAAAAGTERSSGKAKSCIVLFLLGGPPQHETWDPKPDAPPEIRGDLKPIASSVPGLMVGELMPRTARLAHKLAVLRAVSTGDNAHSSSGYYMTTGRPHAPMGVENAKPGAPNDWPSLGAMLRRIHRGNGGLPAAITLPEKLANDGNLTWPGQDGGFLGRTADPWLLHCDPSADNFQVPELALPGEVPPLRFDGRRALLEQVDRHLNGPAPSLYSAQSQQALDLLRSPRAREAFDLQREPPRLRDRYGRNKFGQSVLLARRLVEAGVALVQVTWTRVPNALNNGHWDTHARNTAALKTALMPRMDQAYEALLEDLDDRGLLDETLVVWTGEFGRTPRINGNGGRDHWGQVFSAALAGGGVRGGIVHGASDRIGAQPNDGRVLPPDLLATIFHCLGHRPDTEIHDALGRPLPVSKGEVIRSIL
jgi:uncharacterized protein (DUF1501 family)